VRLDSFDAGAANSACIAPHFTGAAGGVPTVSATGQDPTNKSPFLLVVEFKLKASLSLSLVAVILLRAITFDAFIAGPNRLAPV